MNILIVGVYLTDRRHLAHSISANLLASRQHAVTLRWAALGPPSDDPVPATLLHLPQPQAKFALVKRLAGDASAFDWLVICDDDVDLPPDFLDRFIAVAEQCDFALCQPARTLDSFIDHSITGRMAGLTARRTRFVEIGPVVAIRHDVVDDLLSLTEGAGMGWGLDFVWPALLEARDKRLGIVDATPIEHKLRPPALYYSTRLAKADMFWLLARNRHLSYAEASTILETFR